MATSSANKKQKKVGKDETDRQAAIRAVMMDTSISQVERQRRIQQILSGNMQNESTTSSSNDGVKYPADEEMLDLAQICPHYERGCLIVATSCCNKVYPCRLCHNEHETHEIDRYAIAEVICRKCGLRQSSKTQNCQDPNCGNLFGAYHCDICNFWMGEGAMLKMKPFHCDKCGLCRVGGRENYVHCDICCMCVQKSDKEHKCRTDKYKEECPVCREDMFSSRAAPVDLPCGHSIHANCYHRLTLFHYRCPLCKKTACSRAVAEREWESRSRDISMQPMPPERRKKVTIFCNDCDQRSDNVDFHYLGNQCPNCKSFNTAVVGRIEEEEEEANSPTPG